MKIILILDVRSFADLLNDNIKAYRRSVHNLSKLTTSQVLHAWIVERSFKQSGLIIELPFSLTIHELKTIGSLGASTNIECGLYALMGKVRNLAPTTNYFITSEMKRNYTFIFTLDCCDACF